MKRQRSSRNESAAENSDSSDNENDVSQQETSVKRNKQHRKDKPWDTEDVEHWKIEPFSANHGSGSFLEESSFVTLFPKYREHYLRSVWPEVERALRPHAIAAELDAKAGELRVRTTPGTFDPYIIIKARDLMRLLARSMPLPKAVKVLDDGFACDVVRIGGLVTNRERLARRRMRLLGPQGNTVRALELLTECTVQVQGNTVAILGPHRMLKVVRRIVIDCMHNIHPIYHIKELMIKRELAKDPALANENWDRFLPKFRKRLASSSTANSFTPTPTASQVSSTSSATSLLGSADAASDDKANEIEKPASEQKSQALLAQPQTSEFSGLTRTQKINRKKKLKKKMMQKRKQARETGGLASMLPKFQPSKIDLQIESGEYFLKPMERAARIAEEKALRIAKARKVHREARTEAFKKPSETKQ